jgi:ADP-ribosyl-[dinitrogen reductase] hydrolase
MKKTSLTHPLQIAAVSPGVNFGRIGITFCPGKYDPYGGKYEGGAWWDRDLAVDLDAIRDWGAEAVVTLLRPEELARFRVKNLGDEVKRRGMRWFHLPIVDPSIPDEEFEQEWVGTGQELRSILRQRRDVVVHCRGGLGRAGTIAARLLVEFGAKPSKAIATVREARGLNAIENDEQEEYIHNIRPVPE